MHPGLLVMLVDMIGQSSWSFLLGEVIADVNSSAEYFQVWSLTEGLVVAWAAFSLNFDARHYKRTNF